MQNTRLASRWFATGIFFATLSLALAPRCALAWEWSWGGKSVSGSGNVKSETRSVSGFNAIALSLPAKLELKQGTSEGISLETDDNFLPLIETVVESGTLKIRPIDRNTNFKGRNFTMKIVVNAINIEKLSVAGAGDIVAQSLRAPKLKASIAGSGDVKIVALDSDSVSVSIAGSGNFGAGGKTNSFDITIAGSGDVNAPKLEAKDVKVSVAGSGDATGRAKDNLKMSIAGSGDVKYYGDPKVSNSVVGSGSSKRLGAAP